MIAFLSAAGIKAAAEMQKICERIVAIKAEGLQLECTIFVGEQAVLDDYQQRIATGDMQHAGITVKLIPATATVIANLLRDSPVQFVHFFCHGIERRVIWPIDPAPQADGRLRRPCCRSWRWVLHIRSTTQLDPG